jgi:16S rRNA (guanine(966)-N(2))-methyltransferase RsmD
LRETLFNILAARIEGVRFLDLCAGSGAVGIEALSRGAAHATFVDRSRKMCALIEANLAALDIPEDKFEIVCSETMESLRRRTKKEADPFDIVFYDPPYSTDYEPVMDYAGGHVGLLLADGGLMVVEHHRKKGLGEEFGMLYRARILKQGDSCLSFYGMLGKIR